MDSFKKWRASRELMIDQNTEDIIDTGDIGSNFTFDRDSKESLPSVSSFRENSSLLK